MSLLLVQGNALTLSLADAKVDCCLCSPPYLGLRHYAGLPATAWPAGLLQAMPGVPLLPMPAWEGCLGEEPDLMLYIWHLILVFREVKRVLKPTGVAWVNLGDSFANEPGNGRGGKRVDGGTPHRSALPKRGFPQGSLLLIPHRFALAAAADGWIVRNDLVWHKKTCMPESVNGWRKEYARCACLTPQRTYSGQQHAPANGHREHPHGGVSVLPATQADPTCPLCHGTGHTEELVLRKGSWRHTRAHESVFMLTKTMGYFCNAEAVREPLAQANAQRTTAHYTTAHRYGAVNGGNTGLDGLAAKMRKGSHAGRNPRSVLTPPATAAEHLTALVGFLETQAPEVLAAYTEAQRDPSSIVSPRPAPFTGHFATFPADLVTPLIQAACPERVCPACKAPWAPMIAQKGTGQVYPRGACPTDHRMTGRPQHTGSGSGALSVTVFNHGLTPTCTCYCTCNPLVHLRARTAHEDPCRLCGNRSLTQWEPGVVLDCFAGSGTVGLAARALQRRSMLVEISPDYLALARERIGLADLAAWEGKHGPAPADTYDDLPLFGSHS